ncbi:MAG: radical SAM protein [Candidatus Pacebacteria bacterium]|nr:radical SAM protein [Candidatus Paceibacterota bacterium]
MKILIINISLRPNSEKMMFPIGLGYISTAIEKAGFNFEIFDLDALRPSDLEIEEYIKKTDFDVAAFGCIVTGYKYVKKLAELIKKYKNVPIIVGNSVATSIPELLLTKTKVDIAVMGEGDITIIELLKAIENKNPLDDVKGIVFLKDNKVFFTPERELILNLDELPFINYDLFDMETYLAHCKFNVGEPYPMEFDLLKALPINTARGCPNNCTFCYHVFKRKRYRIRSIENIGREIKHLKEKYGLNYIQFSDELTLFSKEQANKFADYFLKENLGVFWQADCRAGLFGNTDLDLALKLQKAGCVELGYSLESADEEILKAMDKKITVQDFVIQTKILQKAGISTSTSVVIGYPQETEETIKKTLNCCLENNIYPSTGYLLPQPGTPMYDYARTEGIIKDEEEYLLKMGDRQDFTINLTKMPQERMEELVKEYLKKIAEKMELNLKEESLIKTGHYRQKIFLENKNEKS